MDDKYVSINVYSKLGNEHTVNYTVIKGMTISEVYLEVPQGQSFLSLISEL